jgi:tetratricopeptide (TPR) repeat protein
MLSVPGQIKFAISVACTLALCLPAFADESADHVQRALQYEFAGQPKAAVVEYRAAVKADPNNVDAHMRLGIALINYMGDVDGAISEYMTALGIDPKCGPCQRRLDEAVDRRNGNAPDNITLGNEFYKVGQLARSVGAYRLAIFLDPKNSDAHNSLAWTLYRMGELQEALAEVNEALRLKPEEPEYINTLACILYDKGDTDAAIEHFQKAIAKSKKANPADLYGLAVGFLTKGDIKNATDNFKEALKSDPNYKDSKYLRDRVGMSVHALAMHDKLLSLAGEAQK